MDISLLGHNPQRYLPTHPLYPNKNKYTRVKKEKVLDIYSDDGYTTLGMYLMLLNCMLTNV